ncbi:MAG: hypothetical protein OEX00_12665, partial [Gammaproteobacteria bacterium]|nr:hypothetical protein [Gammaproteobacteria bacterium]
MNDSLLNNFSVAMDISTEKVFELHEVSMASEHALVHLLAQHYQCAHSLIVESLASLFAYEYLTPQRLNLLLPEFNKTLYSEVLTRNCLIMRDANQAIVVVIDDPFAIPNLEWAEKQFTGFYSIALAEKESISAFLARYEESMNAMDAMVPDET